MFNMINDDDDDDEEEEEDDNDDDDDDELLLALLVPLNFSNNCLIQFKIHVQCTFI